MRKIYMKVIFITLFVLILASCKRSDGSDDNEKNIKAEELSQREVFDAFLERLARESLEESPLKATFTLGDLKANGLFHLASDLDHLDLSTLEKDIEKAEAELDELTAIDATVLSQKQQLNYELARFSLKHGIDLAKYKYIGNLIQPSSGVQVNFPIALMQIEFETKDEIDAFVKRVQELLRLFDEVIEYEKVRFDLGYGLPGFLYDDVVDQIDAMLVDPKDFMMYLSFSDRVDGFEGLSEEEKQGYKDNYLYIIRDEVYPAFNAIKEQAKAMTGSSASGSISEWSDGKDYYEALVKYKTSDELDVQGLKDWAGAEITEITLEFQKIINDDPAILDLDFESLFPTYTSMDEIYSVVNEVYKTEFNDYGVTFATENIIPSYLEEHLAAGFYFPITVDGEDYGNMFLQAKDYENLTADTAILYYHENIPGHHLYYSYIAKSDEPLFRKMNEYLPYEEGWATYVQELAFSHLGLPEGMDTFFRLNSRYSNAFMVLLDIKFHYEGMSLEDVKSELYSMGYEVGDVDSVVNRMISNPGEMIHYMFGEYKMNQFKDLYIEKMGKDYNVKDFHDLILSHYGLPFYLVEEAINNLQ